MGKTIISPGMPCIGCRSWQGKVLGKPLGLRLGPIIQRMGLILGFGLDGPTFGKQDFSQSFSPSHVTYTSSQMSSHVECGGLLMAGKHPRSIRNRALVTDDTMATDHSAVTFEAWTTVSRNCLFLQYRRQPTGRGFLILPYSVLIVVWCSVYGLPALPQ